MVPSDYNLKSKRNYILLIDTDVRLSNGGCYKSVHAEPQFRASHP